MARKVALLADIHGNLPALDAVLDHIHKNYIDKNFEGFSESYPYKGIIFAGDVLDYGVDINDCIYKLFGKKFLTVDDKIVCCFGNHDLAIMDNDFSRFRTEHGKESAMWSRNNLESYCKGILNMAKEASTNRFEDIMVCHGNDTDPWFNVFINDTDALDEMILRNPDVKVFIVAHSHLQFKFYYRDRLFINPGSVGQSRNGVPKAHYAIFDLDNYSSEFYQINYDIDTEASRIRSKGLDIFLSQRLYLGI